MPKPIFIENNLINILNENIKLLSELDKNIRINFQKESTQILFKSDKEQLSRVFFNLIKNAIESIKQKEEKNPNFNKEISIEIRENNGHISIIIIDNGLGFSVLKKILKIFYIIFYN